VSWSFYDNPKKFARVALCGQISEYESESRGMIPNPFKNCIYTSVKIHGQKARQISKASLRERQRGAECNEGRG
jgi:NADPH-dependent curcumin reductase CurA